MGSKKNIKPSDFFKTTTANGNKLTIAGELASNSNIGVAKFSSDNFTVTTGDVTVTTIDGGSF